MSEASTESTAGEGGRRRGSTVRGGVNAAASVMSALAVAVLVASCASVDRLPAVPLALAHEIRPLDIPYARFYADGDPAALEALTYELLEKADAQRRAAGIKPDKAPPARFLAISGGGDDGAFGAGLLVGWTARGDRPEFAIVTGISTGALTAPFAFLGPEYDDALRRVYTQTNASMIFSKQPPLMSILQGDGVVDTTPLKQLIAGYVDEVMIRRIAEEYDEGRLLLIATTNLDQARSVIWNIGAIAKSADPRARELIIEVLRASASLPGLFPPVMLDVTVDGTRHEEMHVDGGAVAQAFLYPPALRLKAIERKVAGRHSDIAYIIRNGRLFRPEESVKRQTLAIAGKAIATMTAANAVNDLYRIYLITQRDSVDYNLAYIGDDFEMPYKGPFDEGYMNTLFEHGYRMGAAGYPWKKTPPGYER